MERYAGIPKQAIKGIQPDSYGNKGAITWNSLIDTTTRVLNGMRGVRVARDRDQSIPHELSHVWTFYWGEDERKYEFFITYDPYEHYFGFGWRDPDPEGFDIDELDDAMYDTFVKGVFKDLDPHTEDYSDGWFTDIEDYVMVVPPAQYSFLPESDTIVEGNS